MCSAIDPRNKEPLCEGDCGQPAILGLERCAECQARLHFDRDEPGEVDALVADGFLTQERANEIARECADYVAWAQEQNRAAVARMGQG